jgi:hypothetical protein
LRIVAIMHFKRAWRLKAESIFKNVQYFRGKLSNFDDSLQLFWVKKPREFLLLSILHGARTVKVYKL